MENRNRQMPNVAEARRKTMAAVKHKNTKPELIVRSIIHKLGYRFTVSGPKNRELLGSPDIVLPGRKTVIFIHGCFWHGHKECQKYKPPKTRTDFWNDKINRNRVRDDMVSAELIQLGWNVITIWECQLKKKNRQELEMQLINEIKPLIKSKSKGEKKGSYT